MKPLQAQCRMEHGRVLGDTGPVQLVSVERGQTNRGTEPCIMITGTLLTGPIIILL